MRVNTTYVKGSSAQATSTSALVTSGVCDNKVAPPTSSLYSHRYVYMVPSDVAQGIECTYPGCCTFAYCQEEIDVWTLERKGMFCRESMFGGNKKVNLTIPHLLQEYSGTFVFLCEPIHRLKVPSHIATLQRYRQRSGSLQRRCLVAGELSHRRSPATNDPEVPGNQGKHRVTKRRAALSNPMFTLVTILKSKKNKRYILTFRCLSSALCFSGLAVSAGQPESRAVTSPLCFPADRRSQPEQEECRAQRWRTDSGSVGATPSSASSAVTVQKCFDHKPRIISEKNKDNFSLSCSHPVAKHDFEENKCLVHMFRDSIVKYCKIRPFNNLLLLDLCRHEVRYGCIRDNDCFYAHSLVELRVWVIQEKTGLLLPIDGTTVPVLFLFEVAVCTFLVINDRRTDFLYISTGISFERIVQESESYWAKESSSLKPQRRCSDTNNDPDRCSVAVWSLESCHTDRSPATNDAGNQGKHRVTKRRAALSNPMFTLVTILKLLSVPNSSGHPNFNIKFVCGQCWRNGQVIESEKSRRYCSAKARHMWTKDRQVVLVMSNERKKWITIRPCPAKKPVPVQFELCHHILNGKKCQYIGNCAFAHSQEEKEIWTFMKDLSTEATGTLREEGILRLTPSWRSRYS
ncbi:unnamed protein product [Ranitomeya imitator]|uniref:C3H1-type domain-containing protein n=1 Tax=Ranitomeya imitator TaxID=111125 RepID=A0ABN9KQ26_9NEOB|nr:unnamed protein product [Ranitomeya imitator]